MGDTPLARICSLSHTKWSTDKVTNCLGCSRTQNSSCYNQETPGHMDTLFTLVQSLFTCWLMWHFSKKL